jgi:hypothetical protein
MNRGLVLNSPKLVIVVFFLVLLSWILSSSAQELTPDNVLKLKRAGISDAIIKEAVRAGGMTDDILKLKKAGVGEAIILEMLRNAADSRANSAARSTVPPPSITPMPPPNYTTPAPTVPPMAGPTSLRVVVSGEQVASVVIAQLAFGVTGTYFYGTVYVDGIAVGTFNSAGGFDKIIPLNPGTHEAKVNTGFRGILTLGLPMDSTDYCFRFTVAPGTIATFIAPNEFRDVAHYEKC